MPAPLPRPHARTRVTAGGRVALAVLAAWLALLPVAPPRGAAADIDGTTYTGPLHGFTFNWTDAWLALEDDSSSGFDMLVLSNGTTVVEFLSFDPSDVGTPDEVVAELGPYLLQQAGVDDPEEMPGALVALGLGAGWAGEASSYVVDRGDGPARQVGAVAARELEPGRLTLLLAVVTADATFPAEAPRIAALLARIPGNEAPAATREGEPPPVFVSGSFRIAVRAAARVSTSNVLGLATQAGRGWLVVVADVTNWSGADGWFDGRLLAVRVTGNAEPIPFDAERTRRAARALDLSLADERQAVQLSVGETARVVAVFSLPRGTTDPELIYDGVMLPLGPALTASLDPGGLGEIAYPPAYVRARITAVIAGDVLEFTLDDSGETVSFHLVGVGIPKVGACFDRAAQDYLETFVGRSVEIELERFLDNVGTPDRYVWLLNVDGTRTLLNQRLIARGLAYLAPLTPSARFGPWLTASEAAARAAGAGMWSACPAPVSDGLRATPAASPGASR